MSQNYLIYMYSLTLVTQRMEVLFMPNPKKKSFSLFFTAVKI